MLTTEVHRKIKATLDPSRPETGLVHKCPHPLATVYLMRGLPSCGKSTTARQIAGDHGVVLETDAFFYRRQGGRLRYCYDSSQLETAREWNLKRYQQALQEDLSPLVVDRGNGLNAESRIYATLALQHGYRVEICEPDSPWWREIRVLLRYRPDTDPVLDAWADALAELSRQTHSVPRDVIRSWMNSWVDDVTVQDILDCY